MLEAAVGVGLASISVFRGNSILRVFPALEAARLQWTASVENASPGSTGRCALRTRPQDAAARVCRLYDSADGEPPAALAAGVGPALQFADV
jgi:hypothetical protein